MPALKGARKRLSAAAGHEPSLDLYGTALRGPRGPVGGAVGSSCREDVTDGRGETEASPARATGDRGADRGAVDPGFCGGSRARAGPGDRRRGDPGIGP